MGKNLLTVGLILVALAVGLTLAQQHFQQKPDANAKMVAEVPAPAKAPVPALRGKPVAEFALPNLSGATVHSTDFKDKVVLVNFWATWCEPCIVEIPWFIEFQKKYGPKGLEVVGISLDEAGAKDVTPFVAKHQMTYTVLLGNDKVASQFGGILGLPTTFLVDRNGKYYSMHRGLVNHDAIETELLNLLDISGSSQAPATTSHVPAKEPEQRGGIPTLSPIPTAPAPQKS